MRCKIISKNKILTGFKYFWGKKVTAFNDKYHCAKSLVGEYSKVINNKMKCNEYIEVEKELTNEGDIFYICGVSTPYIWKNNFHLALLIKEGEKCLKEMYNGDVIEVIGAKEIYFDYKIAYSNYSYKGKAFTTCRNFQFGSYAVYNGILKGV
jgi:hypothetical protein